MDDSTPNEIDVRTLTTHQVTPDGSVICPALQARYGDESMRLVFPLGNWRLEAAEGSKDFILTMSTSDGFEVAFVLSAPTIVRMTSAMKDQASTGTTHPRH